MAKLGFHTNENGRRLENLADVYDYIDEFTKKRDSLPYVIDGIVLKVDDLACRRTWATPSRCPAGKLPTSSRRKKKKQ